MLAKRVPYLELWPASKRSEDASQVISEVPVQKKDISTDPTYLLKTMDIARSDLYSKPDLNTLFLDSILLTFVCKCRSLTLGWSIA